MSVEIPPPRLIRALFPELVDFVTRVGATRVTPDLYITSWWRSQAKNQRVGGHPFSQHRLGLALDVAGPINDMDFWFREARSVGLFAVAEGSHVHVQSLPAGEAFERFPNLFT